jgi:hypothetical protein
LIPRRNYHLNCSCKLDTYLNWTEGELREVDVGQLSKKRKGKKREISWYKKNIPAPYYMLVAQLLGEAIFGATINTHEGRRREAYAYEVLDLFGEEILSYVGPPAAWRSRVLTPILQRLLWGVYDAYSPAVRAALAGGAEEPTILGVTDFYLSADPVNAGLATTYRRNVIYNPDARWYLSTLCGQDGGSTDHYKKVRRNHDRLTASFGDDPLIQPPPGDVPLLRKADIDVIFDEGLSNYFLPELRRVVRGPAASSAVSNY